MAEFFCGAIIFAAGAFFAMGILGLAQAAAKEFPKQPEKEEQ
jgi:hypothetical protein